MAESFLHQLNPEQRRAVTHAGGPLLILAGAGSGKTRVLTYRIAHLLASGEDPGRILAITFTNKAAAEMRERVERLVGPRAAAMWVGTFHAMCARMLRQSAGRPGFSPNFAIFDEGDQAALVLECVRDLNLDEKAYRPPGVVSAISRAKDELLDPTSFGAGARDYYQRRVAEIYARYQARLQDQNALDFGDLIMRAVELLLGDEDRRAYYGDLFRHVLVDEYQDTNHAQYRFIALLAARHRNLVVVGDDDQSIYRWRGADINNILNFERDFPDATVVRLEQNYRSTGAILDVANRVIATNVRRKGKELWTARGRGEPPVLFEGGTEHDEAFYAAREIERLRAAGEAGLGDCAVLYRTHAQSRVFEDVFMRLGLPYVIVGGLRFYERREIKDVLAYLRLVANPRDTLALRRAAGAPPRGIGPKTVAALEAAAAAASLAPGEALPRLDDLPGLDARSKKKLLPLAGLIRDLGDVARAQPVAGLIEAVLERSGYLNWVAGEGPPDAEARVENIKELVSVAREFDAAYAASAVAGAPAALYDFLAGVTLVSAVDSFRAGEDAVALMTLHTAKGLEFFAVFVVGMEEKLFPHARAIDDEAELEEERRLCYVGMTRARDRLYLTRAWQRSAFGVTMINAPSRFLNDIPASLVRHLSAPAAAAPGAGLRRPVGAGPGGERRAGQWADEGDPDPDVPGYIPPDRWRPRPRRAQPARGAGAETEPRPAIAGLAAGDRVRHPRFGVGTVVAGSGTGEDEEVTVAFPGAGVKRLLLKFAGLERA
jgi:DNA helicase-2/ATP-dependent DNA helicase PcrA